MSLAATSTRRALVVAVVAAVLVLLGLAVGPELAVAQGDNPLEEGARNALSTAQVVLGAVFTILLGFVAIKLFAQRNFGGLAVTLLVGGIVAWVVFNPTGAGETLQSIGDSLLGS